MRGGEKFPTLTVSWQASAVRGEEVRHFHEVAGMSIVAAGCLHSAVDTCCRQPSVYKKKVSILQLRDEFLLNFTLT